MANYEAEVEAAVKVGNGWRGQEDAYRREKAEAEERAKYVDPYTVAESLLARITRITAVKSSDPGRIARVIKALEKLAEEVARA